MQVQSVSFLNYLWQVQGIPGPFLVVAPLSTLPHWQREFERYVLEGACSSVHEAGATGR